MNTDDKYYLQSTVSNPSNETQQQLDVELDDKLLSILFEILLMPMYTNRK